MGVQCAPARRVVLVAGITIGITAPAGMLLAGCQGSPDRTGPAAAGAAQATPPDEDLQARDRVAARTRQLLAASRSGPRGLSRLLGLLARDHLAHLAALGAGGVAATPAGTAVAAPALAAAEWTGAREALAELTGLGPGMAALLARIAAARAVHADLVAAAAGLPARTAVPRPAARSAAQTAPPPTPEPAEAAGDDVAALGRLLAGQHAAVYAYGVVAARADSPLAERLWQAHVADRDSLERAIVAAGGTPVAAAAGYDIGEVPTGTAAARSLAVRVERGLATLANAELAGVDGSTRLLLAQQLVGAARREAAWRARPQPFPGSAG